jgi:hypothetical protein
VTTKDSTRAARISDRLAERGLYGHVRAVARARHVFELEVLGTGRNRSAVAARHALWKVLYEDVGLSYPEIAEIWETTPDVMIRAAGKASGKQASVESRVAARIAAYVRGIGYVVLAKEIEAGAWRPPQGKCSVPSCPHPGLARLGGRCTKHPDGEGTTA